MTTASITSVNSTQNVDPGYNIYLVDATNDNITLTLPDITSDGYYFTFRRTDIALTNNLTVIGNNNTQTIDNLQSITINDAVAVSVVSHGDVWWRL